jgi:hypothetical protein
MATKSDQHAVKLTGPGLTFERPVSKEVATSIINLVMTGVATAAPSPTSATAPPSPTSASGDARPLTGEITPKQFIAQKRPSTDYQRIACLAFYLTHHRGTPEFKTRHITKLSTEAALKLSNPSRDVQNSVSAYRFLVPAGGGKKQITSLGEAIVEALPDQGEVKAAIAEHKPRRRKKRLTKTK